MLKTDLDAVEALAAGTADFGATLDTAIFVLTAVLCQWVSSVAKGALHVGNANVLKRRLAE